MPKSSKVALVIPAYNESETIATVVKDLKDNLKKASIDGTIVVVDDGSKDDTSQKAAKQGAKVIEHVLNSGSGAATATGLSYANQMGFDIAATLDADGQHKPKDVIKGIKLLQKGSTDLLVGSRLIDSAGMSKTKVLGNRGLSLFTHLLFGVSVTDSQSGLRIFSKNALENLRWKTSGYEFCSEMLWRAKQQRLAIDEYPIDAVYTEYSQSKGQSNWNGFNIIKSLLQRRFMELFGE